MAHLQVQIRPMRSFIRVNWRHDATVKFSIRANRLFLHLHDILKRRRRQRVNTVFAHLSNNDGASLFDICAKIRSYSVGQPKLTLTKAQSIK